jgi:valyl-tRNA synthetase
VGQSYSLPKNYEPSTEEPKWQQWWQDRKVHRFDPGDSSRPVYSIDTPPPYPSGEFHVGNALNWSYFDFIARYKRMRGYNVHFPQGWDCNGLPTEVRAEKTHKIRKNDVPLAQFVEMCRKLTEEHIAQMKKTIIRLGISSDWELEYKTMDHSYYRLTQLSFLRLYKTGHMYRGEHPVNWCPRCETAIAEAEVEREERQGSLHYLRFGESGDSVELASTRPELLAACVAIAVHPEDPRYAKLVGKQITVPLFKQRVKVISDNDVDSSFGTGAVMVCTFGDKMDVTWQKRHELPVIRAISDNGRLTEAAGQFKGLRVEEGRKQIVEQLKHEGRLSKTENSQQNVGTCWRCHTPVEILARPQWFMRVRNMTPAVIDWTGKLHWIPPFARQRMIDWAQSLDWDWVVSRQRLFATPIPVWYCKKCSETATPPEDALPVDPRKEPSPIKECPKCGSGDFVGEADVFDTWMDSSISSAVHAGWPNESSSFKRLFPADLQPNGFDIIRTWDYYLLVRGLALFGTAPYKTLLINGMVRGTDGRMMHKSYGNYVETEDVLKKLGADALRQWAATGGSTGQDIPFRWADAEHGRKFLTKLWNVARFTLGSISSPVSEASPAGLSLLDRWILSSTQKLIAEVTEALDGFQFNVAMEAIRNFTWHSLADNYLEAVKYRLQPEADPASREAARHCLYHAIVTVCKLVAPFCPHISESIYQMIPKKELAESVHLTVWPRPEPSTLNDDWVREGNILVEAIALGRRRKSENGMSLSAPVKRLHIAAPETSLRLLKENQETIVRTLRAEQLTLEQSPPSGPGGEADMRVEIFS